MSIGFFKPDSDITFLFRTWTPTPKFNVPENIVFIYVGKKNPKDSENN